MGIWKGIIHSAAFAPREQLSGKYLDNITRDGFTIAHDISSYSFTALAKFFKDYLNDHASLITLSYIGSQKRSRKLQSHGSSKSQPLNQA